MLDDNPLHVLGWHRPAWHADAACKEHPELSWFPERGQPVDRQKAICAGCHVRVECAAHGLEHHEEGIWGGISGRGRRVIRSTNRPAA